MTRINPPRSSKFAVNLFDPTTSSGRSNTHGFSLIELLVVIVIISASLAILIPSLNKFTQMVSGGTARSAINTAVTAARAYAGRNIGSMDVNGTLVPYAGAAIIFTPVGELRLVEHDQAATSTGGSLLHSLTNSPKGYRNIAGRDDIKIPRDTGIVGISRDATGLLFHTPPFAVRFNQHGQLIAGESAPNTVYYDGNFDHLYETTSTNAGSHRAKPYGGGTYDLDVWDPNSSQYTGTGLDPNSLHYPLPFEELEAVVGLMIYSKQQFRDDGGDWPNTAPTTGCGANGASACASINAWIQANATPLFFSRYSGTTLQYKQP